MIKTFADMIKSFRKPKRRSGLLDQGGDPIPIFVEPVEEPVAPVVPTPDLASPIHGLDVSRWQGKIDWDKVTTTQNFVYIKATQGVGYQSPASREMADKAAAAGIPFGFYHYATPGEDDCIGEVNYFIHTLKNELPQASLPPVLDFEENDTDLARGKMGLWASAFLKELEDRMDTQAIIYGSPGFLDHNLLPTHDLGQWHLWLAHYTVKDKPRIPVGWTDWLIWQYSDQGVVDGVENRVDMNHSRMELLHLLK